MSGATCNSGDTAAGRSSPTARLAASGSTRLTTLKRGFAARRSGSEAKCPRRGCGREIYLVDTEPVPREAQPVLFE